MKIRILEHRDKQAVECIFDLYWKDDFREILQNKLDDYLGNKDVFRKQDFHFYVCEEKDEILGVSAYRKAPEHMVPYTQTSNPAELYVNAVKEKGNGVGKLLRNFRINEAKKNGYTEFIFFSGEKHKDSWVFHDNSGFERVSETIAPNGERGYIWRMSLI